MAVKYAFRLALFIAVKNMCQEYKFLKCVYNVFQGIFTVF